MRIRTYYSPTYAVTGTKTFARLSVAATHIEQLGLVDIRQPPPFRAQLLRGLHCERYLQAFASGTNPLASSSGIRWSPAVRDAVYSMLAGQMASVEYAQEHGIALNLACGFHHAVFERGSGYCALNGLAFIAHLLPELKVLVIDCDEHGGNGTEELIKRLSNLSQISIFGTRFGCLGADRSWAFHVSGQDSARQYLPTLETGLALVDSIKPDLILYQAGADCHVDDPKSRARISEELMYRRDQMVFEVARQQHIPLVFVVAGGYQAPEIVAKLNANTVRAALSVYGDLDAAA